MDTFSIVLLFSLGCQTVSEFSKKSSLFVPVSISVRIAVFSVTVFYDERVVIVAEQRPDASEEDSFQWMSRVLQVSEKLLN